MWGGCTGAAKCIFMFGFQRPFICDNGKEFIGKKKDCENSVSQIPLHIIWKVHGAHGTPTTQGLVEQGNHTFKEKISNIFREKKAELSSWC